MISYLLTWSTVSVHQSCYQLLVPPENLEWWKWCWSSVCAIGSNSSHRSGPSPLSLITALSVKVLFSTSWLPSLCSHSLTHYVFASFFIHEWKWMSEHVVEEGGEVGLQLSVCLVYECPLSPCIYLCACVRARNTACLSLCRPLRRSWGFATTVMNLVSVHRLPFHFSWQAGSLAGDHVLFLLTHEPVLHRVFSWGRNMIGQPAPVPLVKAFMLTRCHLVLRLWRKKKNCQSLVFEIPHRIYHAVHVQTQFDNPNLMIHITTVWN